MDPVVIVLLGLLVLFVLIALHVPVAASMATVAVICFGLLSWLVYGASLEQGISEGFRVIGIEARANLESLELAVIPLFILMGGFATAAGMSADIYKLAEAWLGQFRGGLSLATIGACAGFGAINGSSIATTATMTRVALPEMQQRGYSAELATGSIAAGGTLGMLIPPSIIMVLYSILTEQSLLAMFAGAVVPGLLAVTFYFIAISVFVRVYPTAGPAGEAIGWTRRGRATLESWRVIVLAFIVSGGIYGGVFTVNEAAAVGAAVAFIFFVVSGRFTRAALTNVLGDAAGTTSLLFLVIIAASSMSYFVTISQAPMVMVETIKGFDLPGWAIIGILMVLFIIAGSIFDTTAAMVLTLPFVYPLVLGIGPEMHGMTETQTAIWWGLMMVVLIEVGMITPPIGLNVFVIHGMAPNIPLTTVFRGIAPFLIADLCRLILIASFPQIVIWLPDRLGFISPF